MANILINTLFNDVQKVTKKTSVNPSIKTISSKPTMIPKIFQKKVDMSKIIKREEISRSLNNNFITNQNPRISNEKNKLSIKKIDEINQRAMSKPKVINKSRSSEKVDPIVKDLRSLNFDELQEKMTKNPELKKKFEEMLNSEDTLIKKKEKKYKPQEYRPSNSDEVKTLERINESNRQLEINNKLNKKRVRENDCSSNYSIGNKISYNKSKVMYEEEYCQECLIYHKLGKHLDLKKKIENEKDKMNPDKKPTIQKTTQIFKKTKNDFKDSSLHINKVQEQIIKQRNEKIYREIKNDQPILKREFKKFEKPISNSLDKTPSLIKKSSDSSLIRNKDHPSIPIKSNKSTTKVNGKKKFEEYSDEDINDFIVDDYTDKQVVNKEMKKIKEKFQKGYYSPTDLINDSESDMEAGFDEIENEERYSEKIAQREDEIEELREKILKKRKKTYN